MNFSILRSWWTLVALIVSLVLSIASYDQWLDPTCTQPAIMQMATGSGTYAYVLDRDGDLNVVLVLGPPVPEVIATKVPLPAPARDLAVSGDRLFLAAGDAGLFALDVSDPTSPRVEGHLPVKAQAVAVADGKACVLDSEGFLDVIDVSDPAAMAVLGQVPVSAVQIGISGMYAYLATGDSGLIIVDIKDPAAPAIVATLETPGRAEDVTADNGFAYVADGVGGLLVVDVSDPAAPRPVAMLDFSDSVQHVLKDNGFLYLTGIKSGLHVVHVLNPRAPREVSRLPEVESVVDLAESLGVLVLVTESGDLLTVDVLNPCDSVSPPTAITGVGPVAAVAMLPPYSLPVTSVFPNFSVWPSLIFPLVVLLRLAAHRRRVRKALVEPIAWKGELVLWIAVAALVLSLGYQLWKQTL
jgi:hypothetical protein